MKRVHDRTWVCAVVLLAVACSESSERTAVGGDADTMRAPPSSSTPDGGLDMWSAPPRPPTPDGGLAPLPPPTHADGGLDAWTPAPVEPITTCEAAEHAPEGAPCDFSAICTYYDTCPFAERGCGRGVLGPRVPYAMLCLDAGSPDAGPCPCSSDGVECTNEICTDSLECLHVPDDLRCAEDAYCDLALGCLPRPAP